MSVIFDKAFEHYNYMEKMAALELPEGEAPRAVSPDAIFGPDGKEIKPTLSARVADQYKKLKDYVGLSRAEEAAAAAEEESRIALQDMIHNAKSDVHARIDPVKAEAERRIAAAKEAVRRNTATASDAVVDSARRAGQAVSKRTNGLFTAIKNLGKR